MASHGGDQRVALAHLARQFVIDHVELGDQNIELECRDFSEKCLQSVAIDDAAGEQMGLQPDAVQRHIGVAQRAQQLKQRLAPRREARAFVLHIVFVEHKPRVRIRGRRRTQRDRKIIRAQMLHPDRRAQRRGILRPVRQRLVDHVPGRDRAAISGHNRFDMTDQFQLGLGAAADGGGPRRHPAIPGKRMAADFDGVLPGKVRQRVGFFEPILAACRMNVRPLHLAFGNDDLAIRDDRRAIGHIRCQRAGTHGGAIRN